MGSPPNISMRDPQDSSPGSSRRSVGVSSLARRIVLLLILSVLFLPTATAIKAANGQVTPMSRAVNNSQGQALLAVKKEGLVVRSCYDAEGHLTEVRTYRDATAMTRTDFATDTYDHLPGWISKTVYDYDLDGRQTLVRSLTKNDAGDAIGSETHTGYTFTGQVNQVDRYVCHNTTTTQQNQTVYQFDALGHKVSEVRTAWDENGNQLPHQQSGYTYDSLNRLTDTRDYAPDGVTVLRRQHSDYDDRGVVTRSTTYQGEDTKIESCTAYVYDDFKRLVQTIVDPDHKHLVTAYGYDALGNQIVVQDARGAYTFSRYDYANHLVDESFPIKNITVDLTNPVWPDGVAKTRVHYDYYSDGQTQRETYYDNDGVTVLSTNAYAYDAQARLTSVTQPVATGQQAVTQYAYRDPGQDPWKFNGDTAEYTREVTDAEQKKTYQAFNGAGQLLRTRHSDGQIEECTYYSNGQLQSTIVYAKDGTRHTINYTYTDDGKLKEKIYPDTGKLVYHYDGFGRRVRVDDRRVSPVGDMAWEYDALGRLAHTTAYNADGTVHHTLSYVNTATGQRAEVSVGGIANADYAVAYTYDTANRLQRVYEGGQTIASYSWDANGNRESLTYNRIGGGDKPIVTRYTYDDANRLTNLVSQVTDHSQDVTAQLCQFTYTLDGLGRRLQASEMLRTVADGTVNYQVGYAYDQLSRLTAETRTNNGVLVEGGNNTYVYDLAGNRLQKNGQGYSYAANSDKLSADGDNNLYSYDRNGNQLTKGKADPTDGSVYEYNWDNQLTKVVKKTPGATDTIIEFRYDVEGNRVSKTVTKTIINGPATTTTQYVVDNNQSYAHVLMELDENGAATAKYTYGDDLLKVSRNGDYYYFYDGLGSTRVMTDDQGNVVNRYTYDAYGNQLVTEKEQTVENEYLFTGERIDTDTGLVYLRARYYDPTTGRFVQQDSYIGEESEPQSLHRYLYCHNSPVNCVDPSGHMEMIETMSVMGLIGGLAGAGISGYDAYLGGAKDFNQIMDAATTGFFIGAAIGFIAPLAADVAPVVTAYATVGLGLAGGAVGGYGAYQSYKRGNYKQAGLRGVLAIVSVLCAARSVSQIIALGTEEAYGL